MNSESAPTGDPVHPARHSLTRAIAAVPDPVGPDRGPDRGPEARVPEPPAADGAWFAVVLRGYDRAQVDARLSEMDRRIRDEIVRADTAEAALSAARSHVRRLQESATPGPDDRGGFGLRVERVLQAAEREASDLREKASAEAAAVVEKARNDADRARQQTEEALLGRAAKLDHEFTARSAALDTREQEVDRILGEAHRDAERIRAEADRSAARASEEAERTTAELLREADRTIERQRADATRDIGRMAALRDEVRQELARLHGLLRGELDDQVVPDGLQDELFGPEPGSGPGSDAGTDDRDDDANVRTAVGTIPPLTVTSIGVLPFGDRSAGGPANGRSFAFELRPDTRSEQAGTDDRSPSVDTARTSDDDAREDRVPGRTPTRSTMPSRGRR